jgi:hypothetical protein
MSGALGIDIAGPLPAIARLVQPTPQCPRADRDALRGQVVRQQRHRPACGLVAAAARVARQGRRQPPRRQRAMKARTPAARPVAERRGLMLCPVLGQPPVDAGAVDPAAAGRLGHGMPLGYQQQGFKTAIHPCFTGGCKCCGQPLAIRLIKPRARRWIMSLHAPREHPQLSRCKTYGDLLSGASGR